MGPGLEHSQLPISTNSTCITKISQRPTTETVSGTLKPC